MPRRRLRTRGMGPRAGARGAANETQLFEPLPINHGMLAERRRRVRPPPTQEGTPCNVRAAVRPLLPVSSTAKSALRPSAPLDRQRLALLRVWAHRPRLLRGSVHLSGVQVFPASGHPLGLLPASGRPRDRLRDMVPLLPLPRRLVLHLPRSLALRHHRPRGLTLLQMRRKARQALRSDQTKQLVRGRREAARANRRQWLSSFLRRPNVLWRAKKELLRCRVQRTHWSGSIKLHLIGLRVNWSRTIQ